MGRYGEIWGGVTSASRAIDSTNLPAVDSKAERPTTNSRPFVIDDQPPFGRQAGGAAYDESLAINEDR